EVLSEYVNSRAPVGMLGDRAKSGKGADAEHVTVEANVIELVEPVDVDDARGSRDALLQPVHELGAARNRRGARGRSVYGVLEGRRASVSERLHGWFSCNGSAGRD